jgi:hypothetical protein
VLTQADYTWYRLGEETGIAHTTLMRWAKSCEAGRRIRMRLEREIVDLVFAILNAATGGCYAPETFRFYWPLQSQGLSLPARADPATDVAVQDALRRMQKSVKIFRKSSEQYNEIGRIGRAPLNSIERVAWGMLWRTFCASAFIGDRTAHRNPPRGCDWYCA